MTDQSEFPNNDHIINFLDYYTGLTTPPHYAVLLTGEWGIGKTFFILDYMKKVEERLGGQKRTEQGEKEREEVSFFSKVLNRLKWKSGGQTEVEDEAKKDDSKAIIKISLNGVQSKDEIDNMIIKEFHPLLNKKGVSIVGKAITTAANIFNADFSHFQTSDFLDVYRKETIYVFDDLERCCMPLESTLGYINSFVENAGCKVIIIGNEEEIRKAWNTEQSKDKDGDKEKDKKKDEDTKQKNAYGIIKEKVIGKTLKMRPETENAHNYFLEQITDTGCRNFLKSQQKRFIEIYEVSELNNLRILQQTISDFERLYKCLEDKHKKHGGFMQDLVYLFFSLSFEIKSGHGTWKELEDWKDNYYVNYCIEFFEKKSPSKNDTYIHFSKYKELFPLISHRKIFSNTTLYHILEAGYFLKEEISDELNSLPYFREKKIWEKIKTWHDEEPEDWNSLLQQFEDYFVSRTHEDIYEVLSIFDTKLFLSEHEIIADDIPKVMSDCKAYIEDIYTELPELSENSNLLVEHGPCRSESKKELKELNDLIISKSLEKSRRGLIKSIKENFLSSESISDEQFDKLNSHPFRDVSILDLFAIEDICDFIMDNIFKDVFVLFDTISHRNYSNAAATREKELKRVEEIKMRLINIHKNLDQKEAKNRFKKMQIEYHIQYIENTLIPLLSGKRVKPDEAGLNLSEEPCQTGNPV